MNVRQPQSTPEKDESILLIALYILPHQTFHISQVTNSSFSVN